MQILYSFGEYFLTLSLTSYKVILHISRNIKYQLFKDNLNKSDFKTNWIYVPIPTLYLLFIY